MSLLDYYVPAGPQKKFIRSIEMKKSVLRGLKRRNTPQSKVLYKQVSTELRKNEKEYAEFLEECKKKLPK